VAVGSLEPGIMSGFHECEFAFRVDEVPEESFYSNPTPAPALLRSSDEQT